MFFFPIGVDVETGRWPIANFVLIAANVLIFLMELSGGISEATAAGFVQDGWGVKGMFGSLFLHGSWLHLIGNMIFLWAFGNAVCGALGNMRYLVAYFLVGWISGAVQNVAVGGQSIGASGAINGVVGMFVVLFPLNSVSCAWYFFGRAGIAEIAGFWLVAFFFAFDIYGAAWGGGDGIGYWAHIGGFLGGVGLGCLVEVLRWHHLEDGEYQSIFVIARGGLQRAPKSEPFRGKTRDQLTRELPKHAVVRPPPKPQDDEPIPMD